MKKGRTLICNYGNIELFNYLSRYKFSTKPTIGADPEEANFNPRYYNYSSGCECGFNNITSSMHDLPEFVKEINQMFENLVWMMLVIILPNPETEESQVNLIALCQFLHF